MSRTTTPKHVLCVSNEGYRVSLIVRRVYPALPDKEAEGRGLIRVIDTVVRWVTGGGLELMYTTFAVQPRRPEFF